MSWYAGYQRCEQYKWYYDSEYPEDPWDWEQLASEYHNITVAKLNAGIGISELVWSLPNYTWQISPTEPSADAQFSRNYIVASGSTNIDADNESLTLSYRGTVPRLNRQVPNEEAVRISHRRDGDHTILSVGLELLGSYTTGTATAVLAITVGTIADPTPNHKPYIPATIELRITGISESDLEVIEGNS